MQKIDIYTIDTLEDGDIEEVVRIENSCFSLPWSEKIFRETLNSGNSYFFKALINNKIVGYSGMYVVLDEGYVYNVAVLEKFRGLGIGTSLVNKLICCSRELKTNFLSLEVRESNLSAIKIYENCGFKKVGIRNNFYDNPKENGVIMTKLFLC